MKLKRIPRIRWKCKYILIPLFCIKWLEEYSLGLKIHDPQKVMEGHTDSNKNAKNVENINCLQ